MASSECLTDCSHRIRSCRIGITVNLCWLFSYHPWCYLWTIPNSVTGKAMSNSTWSRATIFRMFQDYRSSQNYWISYMTPNRTGLNDSRALNHSRLFWFYDSRQSLVWHPSFPALREDDTAQPALTSLCTIKMLKGSNRLLWNRIPACLFFHRDLRPNECSSSN